MPSRRHGGTRQFLEPEGSRRRGPGAGPGLRKAGPRRRRRGVDPAAPALRRPRGDLPLRRPRLQLSDRPGRPPPARDLRLHDRIPRRGRQVRGDARRPALRPPGRRAVRRRPPRDRDRPERPRPAAADDVQPGRADRRPRRDQHLSDLHGRPRGRGQGDALGHGRRRTVRGVPQALRQPSGAALPARPAPAAARGVRGRGPAAGRLGQPGLPVGALREAVPLLRATCPRRPRSGAATPCTTGTNCSP